MAKNRSSFGSFAKKIWYGDHIMNGYFILVGPKDCDGKSSVLTSLLKKLNEPNQHIGDKKTLFLNGRIFVDLDGFGKESAAQEFNEINKNKDRLINKHFKFLFCIKTNTSDENFLNAAEQYFEVFGRKGIKATVLIVIQDEAMSANLDTHEPKKKLYENKGYAFLKEKNNNQDVKSVMWDNLGNMYPDQMQKLTDKVYKVSEFHLSSERFERLERHITGRGNVKMEKLSDQKNEKKFGQTESKSLIAIVKVKVIVIVIVMGQKIRIRKSFLIQKEL